ncbi:MAG: metallopeptidase TldD-related protein [Sorangiineae bacterium]|nr:metallopeptidase TldD-related protein [Polyangiaceae bacterium]MEB2321445.1 metallopeptidase TldD-related protein [Sorangiineae bacterium]
MSRAVPVAAALGLALSLAAGAVSAGAPAKSGAASSNDPTLAALEDESARAVRELRLPGMPEPYLVTATVLDDDELELRASLGSLVLRRRERSRHLKTEVRVGSRALDSSGFMSDDGAPLVEYERVPFEPGYGPLRRALWLAADRAFKSATARYEAKRALRESEGGAQEQPPSRAEHAPVLSLGERAPALPDDPGWVALCQRLSAVFRAHPAIHESSVRLSALSRTRTLVDSDGTRVVEPSALVRVEIVARTQADDGMPLVHHAAFAASALEGLPPEAELVAAAERVAVELDRLRVAPLVSDYAGPILFEDVAAPELLRPLLADELSGTPLPRAAFGGTVGDASALEHRVGWRVLPLGFEVVDEPGFVGEGGRALVGGYRHDDEGIPGERVSIVEDGTLRALLTSLTPSLPASRSNGHGRAGASSTARGLPSVLLVTTRRGVSRPALRARLLAEARAQGLERAMVVRKFDDPGVTGSSLTPTGASGAVTLPAPVLLYEVDLRGRERLVRGGRVESLSTRDLRRLLAAGRNGTAYSYLASAVARRGVWVGDIPATILAPDLLVADADVRRPTEPPPKPPALPPPPAK